MTPGFQLHLSKVDQVSPKPPAALAGMRFPAQLAQHRPQQQEPGALQDSNSDASAEQQQELQSELQAAADFLPDLVSQ